jgi:hypothetical protein
MMLGVNWVKFHWSRHWVTPMWMSTWYGPQIQLGWLVIAVNTERKNAARGGK